MPNAYAPKPEHKFSFGLWTVSNRGRDPFGDVVRPPLSPNDAAAMLGEVGAWGVNLHDNDLVPIDATPAERDRIVKEFQAACKSAGIVVPMATVNLFYDPVFRDGAFTANDPRVRAYAVQKTHARHGPRRRARGKDFVLWGGREGTETDACRRPDEAVKRLRDAVNYLCEYSIDKKYGFRFAMESKPNEPRGDIYMATTGAYLGFIPTLAHPELVGVNPEVAHEHMAGLNFLHAVAPGLGSGQAVPHRSERSEPRPLRPGLPLRRRQHQVGVLPGEVPRRRRLRRARGTSTRTPTAPRTTTAFAISRAAACAPT